MTSTPDGPFHPLDPYRTAEPYTLLAEGYDAVMEHVDYEAWADFIQQLLLEHAEGTQDVLELGGGTGSLAIALQAMGGYRYRMSDAAEPMLAVARKKARAARSPISVERIDFVSIPPLPQSDAIVLLYDGLNYLLDEAQVARLLGGVYTALRPGGAFVFDQSTPVNSINNADGFDDAGRTGAFRYFRTSQYDADARLHTTLFRLEIDGKTFTETHVQRAYTKAEVEALVAVSGLRIEAAYDGFSLDPAHDESERIHWVLRKPYAGA